MLSVDNDFENIVFSIKDPYHVTNGTISGVPPDSPDSFSVSASWKYQLNGENNVTNMTFKARFGNACIYFKIIVIGLICSVFINQIIGIFL